MSELSEEIQAAVGALTTEPVGRPGVVCALPDDYLRPDYVEGILSTFVAAAPGFRSEIVLQNQAQNQAEGYEISDQWVLVTGATNVQISVVAATQALAGYTSQQILACDLLTKAGTHRIQKPKLVMMQKNSAAAISIDQLGAAVIATPTTSVWVAVPGKVVLRSIPGGGGAIVVRPTADNMAIGYMARWRRLVKRSL